MSLADRWGRLVSGEDAGAAAALARLGLSGLSGLYLLGLRGNLGIYGMGLKRHTQPVLPAISVGNLSLGGAGKTTAVRFLARQLQQRGVTVGIVLRGHGRAEGPEVLLASDGRGNVAPLAQTGDEAAELARALPEARVGVGKRREAVIELLRQAGAQIALLDDGYQYFRMARDLNIALISAREDPRSLRLFPRGVLREPWSHLSRASQVWITHADQASPEALQAVRDLAARHAPGRPVVETRHEARELVTLAGESLPLETLQGRRVLAVSGLGCPESFEYTLGERGAQVTALRFDDHYRYTPDDWPRIVAAAQAAGASEVVTTEKDAVRLPASPPLPVWVLRSELAVSRGMDAVHAALDAIAGAAPGSDT